MMNEYNKKVLAVINYKNIKILTCFVAVHFVLSNVVS